MNAPEKFGVFRDRTPTMPTMGVTALGVEAGLHAYLSNAAGLRARGGQGTGIIVASDMHGRVFKVELSQVDGPK